MGTFLINFEKLNKVGIIWLHIWRGKVAPWLVNQQLLDHSKCQAATLPCQRHNQMIRT